MEAIFASLMPVYGQPLYFTSGAFLVFLLIFLVFHAIAARDSRLRVWVILLFSLTFYLAGAGTNLWVILVASLVTYLAARSFHPEKQSFINRISVAAGITVNLGLLIFFKYTDVFQRLMNSIRTGDQLVDSLIFPMGLSFFTFTNIAYLIDVKKGIVTAERSLLYFLAFPSFFPVVQMGPIERAARFFPSLKSKSVLTREDINEGTLLIINGIIKKMVIGDTISHQLVSGILSAPERHTGIENLAALLGYSLVIYCDFSGYTDMGRGMARWMGFRLTLNFNLPYKARNIGEFWKRWHISLSAWLRDYLFMPIALKLSGMMKKETLFNLPWLKSDQVIFWIASLITFTLCGLWHGAGINFLIWGLMHGVALSVQKTWSIQSKERKKRRGPGRKKFFQTLGIVSTFFFVTLGWVFFKTETPAQAFNVISQIFTDFQGEALPALLSGYAIPLLLMTAGYIWHFLPDRYGDILRLKYDGFPLPLKVAVVAVVISLVWLSQQQGSTRPIYIQF